MTRYRDMRSFRTSPAVARGMALGVDGGFRVAFACAVNEVPRCPIEGLTWTIHPDDYEGVRTTMYQRFGNPPGDTEKF